MAGTLTNRYYSSNSEMRTMVLFGQGNHRPVSWLAVSLLVLSGLLAMIGTWGAVQWARRGGVAIPENEARLKTSAPSRDPDPQVKYVGDEACALCHSRIARTYRQHPMARSCAPVSSVLALERYEIETRNPFQAAGFQFLAQPRRQQLFHKTSRLDSQDRVVAQSQAEVQFVIGAGVRGRSYLMNRQGYLFQSPISWYSERQVWDLSPHLGKSIEPLYRPVQALCLYCHANHVDPVEHTSNQFHEPIFQGYPIGCERCHGPGELHVKRHQPGESDPGEDDGIVNPGHLEPALREAVCQQCHLQGVVRIARRGRQWFDYRPGLPIQEFWSVFVKPPSLDSQKRFSSQVEQMYASRCYRGSLGKLGCISCHDPHQVPAPEQKLGYYRNRCLACHQENSCHLSPTVRRMQSPGDSCLDCHMKRISSTIAHMASTDHRILRRQANDEAKPEPTPPGSNTGLWLVQLGRSPESALVLFDHELVNPQAVPRDSRFRLRVNELTGIDTADPEIARALGLALVELAGLKVPTSVRTKLAQNSLPLLTASVQTWPDDAPAWQGQGYALWLLDRKPEALAALEMALTKAPRREEALVYAAAVSAQLGRDPTAIEYWQRALNVNPWSQRSHFELAKLLVKDQQWQKALSEGREAMALNPFHLETRLVLIECHVGLGDKERARAEFNEVLSLNPPDPAALKRWFDQRIR